MRSVLFSLFLALAVQVSAQEYYLFVGTYTNNNSSKGVYVYKFNAANGKLAWVSNTDSCTNPSFVAVSPGGKYVYTVNETGRNRPGHVSAFSFNKNTGRLSFLNQQLSGGDDPCFITTDPSGKWVVAGNYSGGNLSVFPVKKDGSLSPYNQLIQHTGSSVNKSRQEKAHVHSTFFTPDKQYLLVPDLGMDKVMHYRFNATLARPISVAQPAYTAAEPGAGPRHFAFHPNKRYAYLIEEMGGAVTAFAYHDGSLNALQRIATHPAGFKGQPGSADIHISPDGKFLYASNRGSENNIAIFAIGADGKLTVKGYQSALGEQPRNFVIDPTGKFLLVANQKTNNIVVFKRNITTGMLEAMPGSIQVQSPVCLTMITDYTE